eukprot:CAMPEP_0185539588 /NCGR_PEP_ID=MMETSP1366-20130426/111520_1 /TAXON_ID=38817 /ORGANISM="Gephyrocapsa oceanica, Strain RCC1303" /LENGTH=94 /DNA_ID=CAMNT_0028151309 /DNA_START=497 /DNA_END=781 /DNA_ORIENTATION=-
MTSPDFGPSHVGSCEMTRPHFSSNCSRRSPRQRGGGGAPLLDGRRRRGPAGEHAAGRCAYRKVPGKGVRRRRGAHTAAAASPQGASRLILPDLV